MREKGEPILQNLLFFVSGLALIFLAHTGIEEASPTTSLALEVAGFALAGYAPIRLLMSLKSFFGEGLRRRIVDHAFRGEVRVVSQKKDLPLLIVTDAEGCITPPHRTDIDMRKLQQLRAYCDFVKSEDGRDFPPLLIYTGRPQGYVEMLAQTLGMVDKPPDLPFVIENGAALYFPVSKRMVSWMSDEQRKLSQKVRSLLGAKLSQNEFEPKAYMTTINPLPDRQTIEELRAEVRKVLQQTDINILDSLEINSTASAVDITPKGIDKLSGLKKAIEEYYKIRPDRWKLTGQKLNSEEIVKLALDATVGLGDSPSDLCVLKKVGVAYCPAHDVNPEVRQFVERHSGSGLDHVIDQKHIDFVITAIESECRLRII